MIQFSDPRAMHNWSREMRRRGRTVGLVPTMGFLHEGHLRLLDRARRESDVLVVSLFINPIQFGPGEDLASYPRDLERDRRLSEKRGADCLFLPHVKAMYPTEPVVRVSPGDLAAHLCGASRPGHFEGVLTVVAKLFHVIEPDVAVFGRKDFQQARLIERMVEDLSFAVRVVVAPTVREADGLAMSSRNAYLSPSERRSAAKLSRGLEAAHTAFTSGATDPGTLESAAREVAAKDPLISTEYIEVVDPDTLEPEDSATPESVVAVAGRVGPARLIDNVVLGDGLSGDDVVSG